MRLEDANTPDQFWSSLIHREINAGYKNVLAPISGISQESAIELAIWQKVSLLIQGDKYLFSKTKEGTLVHLGERIHRH